MLADIALSEVLVVLAIVALILGIIWLFRHI